MSKAHIRAARLNVGERHAQPITLDNSELEPDVTIARLPEDIYKQHLNIGSSI
jgi:hypothetical protein